MPPSFDFSDWWSKDTHKGTPVVVTMENPNWSMLELKEPNAAFQQVDKDRGKNAKQLTWVLLLKAHRAAGCVAWLATGLWTLLGAVKKRLIFRQGVAMETEKSHKGKLFKFIKAFLAFSLAALVFEVVAHMKGWHFSTPHLYLPTTTGIQDSLHLIYLSWVQFRSNYIAPPIQALADICIILFLIQSLDRIILCIGCFWIKYKKIKPQPKVESVECKDIEQPGSGHPMVLVQIPMCNEREVYEQSISAVCQLDWPNKIFVMALDDYELNLQTEIVGWECSRNKDCRMKFIRRPRHMKLGMRGLVWSIQALELQSPTEYSFNIMEVKRSEPPLPLSEAAAPNLPEKFELLLVDYKASMQSVRTVDEALDKLYAFSRLFSLVEENSRWWIVLDAEITATTCKCAKEALCQAVQAAVAVVVEQVESPVCIGGRQSKSCERSGWWIDNWTVADEFWANSFFALDSWKCMMRLFQAKAVEGGNVVQWCSVRVSDEPNPNFQFEVAVHEFLDGDDVLLRIGVANDRALKVRVFLNEAVEVVCSQEGVETRTSLGLAYLLPNMVKDYISSARDQNEAQLSSENVMQGLLQHLIRYLVFLGKICVICRSERLSDIPRSSICSNICKATKQRYKDVIARFLPDLMISKAAKATRREQYVKKLYPNSSEGRKGLEILLNENVVDEAKTGECTKDGAINYEEAVRRVTKMNSRSIAGALYIQISDLWIDDDDSFEN